MKNMSTRFLFLESLHQTDEKKYFFVKRLIDIIGATCGIILLLPLFILIAILIKISDLHAPVFFKQIRVGKNGRNFYMYKFRSMCVNAEEQIGSLLAFNEIDGAMFKMKEDPRTTNIGKFIRKTSIDEFPQLWNVIKGDMSLVGPRPPLSREVEKYTIRELQRLSITPGCTGLWQISGRNNLGFDEMVELDLLYIEKLSFINDMKIIFKTFGVILGGKNAY